MSREEGSINAGLPTSDFKDFAVKLRASNAVLLPISKGLVQAEVPRQPGRVGSSLVDPLLESTTPSFSPGISETIHYPEADAIKADQILATGWLDLKLVESHSPVEFPGCWSSPCSCYFHLLRH